MYQSTTPTFQFNIPYTQEQIAKLRITLHQLNTELNFTENDVTFDGKNVFLALTQEQTAMFAVKPDVAIQMRVKLNGSDMVLSSQIVHTDVFKTFDTEVL